MAHVLWLVGRFALALTVAVVLYLIGAGFVRSLRSNVPGNEPPEPRDLLAVDYEFRCIVCGTMVTMTATPDAEVPEAPRHCREDMILVPPIE